MQEAILKLLDGDHSADLAFWIIVGLSFLLGMLVWALLAHWPAARKLRREQEALEKERNLLEKDNKDLSERLTLLNTKHQHLQQEWQTATAQLQEREELVGQQSQKITHLSEELDAYKAQARNFKQANEKLLDEYRDAAQTNKTLYAKLEDMKGLVEDVEQEKVTLVSEHHQLEQTFRQQARQLTDRSRALEQAQKRLEEAEADLKVALEQRAELSDLVRQLETTQQVGNISDEEARAQLIALKTHVQELEQENNDLLERLKPYINDDTENETTEELMVNLLVEAEESMEKDGFYWDIKEDQLVEDPQQLEKNLAEYTQQETALQPEPLSLEEEDEYDLDHCLSAAQLAMERQGFYEDLDAAVLMPLAPEVEQVTDETLLEQRLKDTSVVLKTTSFYNEALIEDDWIEEPEQLHQALQKLDVEQQPKEESSARAIMVDEAEAQAMHEADELALAALNRPGLYEPMDKMDLLDDEIVQPAMDPKESTRSTGDLKTALQYAIQHQLPASSLEERDELQAISGIGYVLEQQLNALGVYQYQQLSQLSDEMVYDLNTYLDLPPNTITQWQWIAQAKRLQQPPNQRKNKHNL